MMRTALTLWLIGLFIGPSLAAQPVSAAEPPNDLPPYVLVDEMPPEMRVAYIRGIQEELLEHGYRPARSDGVYDSQTARSIRRYQRDAGLPIDGEASRELLDHLMFALPKIYAGKQPALASLMLEIQTELQRLGYYRGPLDGVEGPLTYDAAQSFRRDAQLPPRRSLDTILLAKLKATPRRLSP